MEHKQHKKNIGRFKKLLERIRKNKKKQISRARRADHILKDVVSGRHNRHTKKPAVKKIKKALFIKHNGIKKTSGSNSQPANNRTIIKKTLRSPHTKSHNFSKHVDIKNKQIKKHSHIKKQTKLKSLTLVPSVKHHNSSVKPVVKSQRIIHAKPLIKQLELLENKEAMHRIVTQSPINIDEEIESENLSEELQPEMENSEEKEEPEQNSEEKELVIPQQKTVKNQKNSFLSNLFRHQNKKQEELTEKEITQAKNIDNSEEETQITNVSVVSQKTKGSVIEAYTIKLDGASADIKIVRDEISTSYTLNIPKISAATSALLNDLREELIAITSVSMQELIDPKAFSSIKNKFKEEAKKLIREKIPTIRDETESFIIGTLMQEMLGIGKIEYLINDPNLEEIVIVSAKEPIKIYSKKYGWLSTNIILEKEEITINYANIIARRVGRQITVLSPLLDAHLVTGDRVNAVLYPINTKGNTIVIRKFSRDPYTIIDLIKNNTCDLEAAALLWLAVEYEMNVIISGGTASGKTVLLNACMPFIPPNQRIISIEDTKELMLPDFLYWTPLVTRLPNAEGKGAVTMLDLLINSLRMRPDRIILGEMRKHEEAMVLFEAMHTGHSVYATLHADSAAETISRLTHQPLDIPANLLNAINLNVVMFRDRRRGIRRILQIAEIETEGDIAKANTLYRWSPESDKLVKHSKSSRFFEEISRHTSMSEEEINKEINIKKKIITWLINHKIRSLGDLGKTINLYYQNKELLLKKIAKDDINFVLNYGK